MGNATWRNKLLLALYIFAIANLLVSLERMVFDVLGHMWITLFINGITAFATLICIVGTLCKKKVAVVAFIICCLITLIVNTIIILIYNDVGIFSDKEHYLSFTMKNNYWWKNHGYLCYNVCSNGAAGGDEDTNNNDGSGTPLIDGTLSVDEGSAAVSLQHCFVTFVEIETFHASLNMLLILITILLSSFVLCIKKEVPSDDDESFRYLGIGRYGGNALTDPRQPSFYKLSDSFDNLGSLSLSTHSSESTN